MTGPQWRVGPAAATLAFPTAGSTGAPVRWLRTAGQLAAEADLLATVCAAGKVDAVVSFAPPRHLYGYLMARALPQRLGVPARLVTLTDPLEAVFAGLRRPLVATVPAAVGPLGGATRVLSRLDELVLVHSGAVLPADGFRLLTALAGLARLVELFSATETGLVASRTDPTCLEWTVAPDTALAGLAPGQCGPLRVRGPRLAHQPGQPAPVEQQLDDLIEALGPDRFRLLGRRGRPAGASGRDAEPARAHLTGIVL